MRGARRCAHRRARTSSHLARARLRNGASSQSFIFCDLRLVPQRERDLVVAAEEALPAEWIDLELRDEAAIVADLALLEVEREPRAFCHLVDVHHDRRDAVVRAVLDEDVGE